MDVVVLGGHGKVALELLSILARRGDSARGLIRNPDHAGEVEATGAEAVLFDLETDSGLAERLEGANAVVFAAGAGPGSGPERKRTVDLGGALALIEACHEARVSRYVMVSAMGVDHPGRYPEAMKPYFAAKREADEALVASGLDYTIVRPGRLTDDPATGRVEVGSPLVRSGQIPRADVAATIALVLETPASAGLSLDLLSGLRPLPEALARLTGGGERPAADGSRR